jgi:hypothetical protein
MTYRTECDRLQYNLYSVSILKPVVSPFILFSYIQWIAIFPLHKLSQVSFCLVL